MKVAIVGPVEGRSLLQSFLLRFGKSVCADPEVIFADHTDGLPEEQFNLAFLYANNVAIDAVQAFQTAHPSCDIVLWADDEKWAVSGIRMHTASFFVMPISEEQFAQAMQQCRVAWMTGMKTIKGLSEGDTHQIHCADILYAVADGHRSMIYTNTEQLSVNMNLTALAAHLGSGFVRCHRCYIANIRSIREFSTEGIALQNGKKIPVGIGKTAVETEETILAYRSEMGAYI